MQSLTAFLKDMDLMGMDTLIEKYVTNGGPLMWVLVPCSLLTLAAVLQAWIRLRRGRVISKVVLKKAGEVKTAGEREAFVLGLRGHSSPLARSVFFTLKNFNLRSPRPQRHELEAVMDDAVADAGDEMQDGLGLLATIYTVAPLIGLLGTIHGMILTFFEFSVQNQKSLELLAVGIQYALITTLWGLGIAIPDYVAARWLQGKIRRYERDQLPQAVHQVLDLIYAQDDGRSPTADETLPLTLDETEPSLSLSGTEACR